MLQAPVHGGAEQADRHVVFTLPTRTWRLHNLFGPTAFLSALYRGWLFSELKVGDEWFPAHCKMIISRPVGQGLLIIVDPAYPNAWRREPYYGQLLALAQRSSVKIRVGRRFIRLNADGSERQWWRSQAHIEGRSEDVVTDPSS